MKNKSVKLPFITKNSKHLVQTIYSHMKNKSDKLPFVTKNSKYPGGTGADNLLPCGKQKCQISFVTKNKNISLYLHATRTKQSLPTLAIVDVRTVSNLNSLVSSKTCPKN